MVTNFIMKMASDEPDADPNEIKKATSKEFVAAVQSGTAFQGIDIDPASLSFGGE